MAEPYHLFVGGYGGCIYTLEFTPPSPGRIATLTETRVGPQSGADSERSTVVKSAGVAPTWLTLSSDWAYLYATDEWNEPQGQLTAYKVDPNTLALEKLSTVSSQGMWPCHSSLLEHTQPRKFVSTNYKGRSIVIHQVKENGDFDTEVEAVVHSLAERGTPGPHSWRQTQQHPHEAHVDPTGKFLVVSDLGTDDLRVYLISPSGTLTHHVDVALTPSSGPRHVTFSPPTVSHSTLYVSNELSNSVSVFRVTYSNDEASTPSFKLLQDSISTLPDTPKGTQPPFERWHASEIKVHPSGKWLYISNRAEDHDPLNGTKEGENDSVAIFPIDIETGKIDPRGMKLIDCGGRGPRHFAFSTESKRQRKVGNGEEDLWVAIAVHDSDEVVLSKVKEEDGTWEEVARLDGLGRPGIALWV